MAKTKGRPVKLDGALVNQMREKGYTWLTIAITLGCSVNGAAKARERFLKGGGNG